MKARTKGRKKMNQNQDPRIRPESTLDQLYALRNEVRAALARYEAILDGQAIRDELTAMVKRLIATPTPGLWTEWDNAGMAIHELAVIANAVESDRLWLDTEDVTDSLIPEALAERLFDVYETVHRMAPDEV